MTQRPTTHLRFSLLLALGLLCVPAHAKQPQSYQQIPIECRTINGRDWIRVPMYEVPTGYKLYGNWRYVVPEEWRGQSPRFERPSPSGRMDEEGVPVFEVLTLDEVIQRKGLPW